MAQSTLSKGAGWLGLLIVIAFLPLTAVVGITIAFWFTVIHISGTTKWDLSSFSKYRPSQLLRGSPAKRKQKLRVLITGSGPLALAFARQFWRKGAYVLISDVEPVPYLNRLRYSRATGDFIPYNNRTILQWLGLKTSLEPMFKSAGHILNLVRTKKVDLWLPLEAFVQDEEFELACDLVEFETQCKVLYPPKEVAALATDSAKFDNFVQSLSAQVKRPKATRVNSRNDIHYLLGGAPTDQKFMLSPIIKETSKEPHRSRWRDSGFSEPDYWNVVNGSESPTETFIAPQIPHILPLDSMDKTYELLTKVDISVQHPWVAADVVTGKIMQASSVVVDGQLKDIAIFSSSKQCQYPNNNQLPELISPEPLDPSSVLHKALKGFTSAFVASLPSSISSPLNLVFLLQEKSVSYGFEERLWIVSCNFDTSDALFPFDNSISSFVDCIMFKSLTRKPTPLSKEPVLGPYSFPTILWSSILLPLLSFLAFQISFEDLLGHLHDFSSQTLFGKEYLFEYYDPLPWIWCWFFEQPILLTLYYISNLYQAIRGHSKQLTRYIPTK
jgi:hypothetical protein